MASPGDIRDMREYLLSTSEARAVFDKITAIVSADIDEYINRPDRPSILTLDDEKWLIDACTAAAQAVLAQGISLDPELLSDITTQVLLDKHPLGPLMPLLKNPDVQNIHVNGPYDCYYFINGERFYTPLTFKDSDDVINRLVEFFNAQTRSAPINQVHPMGTLVLPTGERCHVVIELGTPNPLITLRKHQPDRFATFGKLAEVGGMPTFMVRFLEACVKARLNTLFAGGVNTGKTTYLRAFGATVPSNERLGVIEDDKELMLLDLRKDTDTFELASRPPNTEGMGEIGMDRLIRDALRMNANRMIVGEVRGKEAHYMLKAMSSGWNGSACTIHAEAAEDVLPQLIGYVFEHEDSPRDEEQVAKKVGRSIHLIVFLRAIRLPDGRERRVMDKVVAVHGWAAGEIALKPIIEYDELRDEWFWVTGQAGEIADENWRRRFRNANIDLDDLVPHDIIERGNKYFEEQSEAGYS